MQTRHRLHQPNQRSPVEGRYFPIWTGGKKHAHNVYAKTREECEQLVTELIEQMKAEIAAEKERLQQKKKTG